MILNCAASINFDDPLVDAIKINFLGCFKLLQLAKQCHNLLAFTHVSTAYVNSNRLGFIEEKVYDLPGILDPVKEIERILNLDP